MVELLKILKSKLKAKTLSFLLVLHLANSWGQTTIFSENMGTGASGNPSVGTYIGFQNYGTQVFSGTGDVRNNTPSSGYTGASGGNNVFLTNSASKTFQICGINTSACSSFTLTFGVWKSSGTTSNGELQVQFSSDGGTTFGSATSLTVTGGSAWSLQTITAGIPAAANICIKFTNTSASVQFRVDDVKLVGNCSGSTSITTGVVGSPPFALTDCTVTANGSVAFTSSGTFNSGNVYTAQLSDASGSFSSPISIGTLTSTANSGTINIVIPASTASGSGYMIRVISNNPSTTGSNSTAFTITLTCAGTSTCSVGGAMGSNETNNGCGDGAACFLASIYSAYGSFCSNVNNVGCSSCITAPVSAVYTLPSGCTASVKAEYKNRGTGCSNSAMDSGDQLYITNSGGTLIGQSASLLNSSCSGTFATTFTTSAIGTGCGNADGVVTMTLSGGQFTVGGVVNRGDEIVTYTINFSGTCGLNCPTILPISLIDFYGVENGNYNDIFWKVAREENIRSYIIEKSEDGVHFREFNSQSSRGNNSQGLINYFAQDQDPSQGITYYRLSTLEGEGNWNIKNYKTISLDRSLNNLQCSYYQQNQNLVIEFKNLISTNNTIGLYDLAGKLLIEETIKEAQTKINIQDFSGGIYFLRITTPYKTQNFKLIIQK